METPTTPTRHVAGEVRAALARKRKTAKEAALATGIPGATFSRKMNGLVPFNVQELYNLAEFLNIPVIDFFPPREQTLGMTG